MNFFSGDEFEIWRHLNQEPVSLAIHGNNIFWTHFHSDELFWANKHLVNGTNHHLTMGIVYYYVL